MGIKTKMCFISEALNMDFFIILREMVKGDSKLSEAQYVIGTLMFNYPSRYDVKCSQQWTKQVVVQAILRWCSALEKSGIAPSIERVEQHGQGVKDSVRGLLRIIVRTLRYNPDNARRIEFN